MLFPCGCRSTTVKRPASTFSAWFHRGGTHDLRRRPTPGLGRTRLAAPLGQYSVGPEAVSAPIAKGSSCPTSLRRRPTERSRVRQGEVDREAREADQAGGQGFEHTADRPLISGVGRFLCRAAGLQHLLPLARCDVRVYARAPAGRCRRWRGRFGLVRLLDRHRVRNRRQHHEEGGRRGAAVACLRLRSGAVGAALWLALSL
jgi:hypothetical protein